MALLFMESFDGYGGTASHMTKWSNLPTFVSSTPSPRTGPYCARQTSASLMTRNFTSAASTVIIGVAYYWSGITNSYLQITGVGGSYVAGSLQFSVVLDSDGVIRLRSGSSSGTLLGASGVVLVASTWNFIEAKVTVANSGSYTIKCNGVTVLTGSGDTQNYSAATIAGFGAYIDTGCAIDDLYVLDSSGTALNDFIGDCKVECLTPQAGNGSNTGLTCSTGTDHGALVDELPANDDTDYNFSATVGAKDTYAFTNVATVGSIKAVQVSARARKTDSATKELAVVARVGSTDYDGATQAVASTTYSQYQQIWEKCPSDNADWTIADVNAAEYGLKVVT
jgi:hypothetical protein